jgi:hypothetical protein
MKQFLNFRYKPIDIYYLLGLIALTSIISTIYISNEQYIYFWDYAHYSDRVSQFADSLRISPFKAIECFVDYLGDDYTQIPSLPLLPFALLFGNSRLVFILSLALAYIVPFCLVKGAIATKIIPSPSRFIFWFTAFFTLTIPATWVSILRGYPDLGGASIIGLAILLYWKDPQIRNRKHIMQIALLLAIAVWFRRPFAYSVCAFLLTLIIVSFRDYFTQSRQDLQQAIKQLKSTLIKVIKIGLWFIAFSPVLVFKILFINYRTLYASYELSSMEVFQYYGNDFGWLICLLSLLGYGIRLISKNGRTNEIQFLFLMGSISMAQWVLFVKLNGSHYTTLFIIFICLGFILLIHSLFNICKFNIISSIFILISAISLAIFSIISGLTTLGKQNYVLRNLFPISKPPLYRSDYTEMSRLINFLRTDTIKNKVIYVAASSETLTSDTLLATERKLYNRNSLKILRTSNIDSRDVYPLNDLLKANLIITSTPVQYHLSPKEQKVVKIAVDIFQKHWSFAQDFRQLSTEFNLDKGVQVKVYQRIRETPLPTILETLRSIKETIPHEPGREPSWLMLQSEQPINIEKDILKTVQFRDISLNPGQIISFLYFGSTSESIGLKAQLRSSSCNNNLSNISLQVSTLNPQCQVLASQPWAYRKDGNISIILNDLASQTSYLRLDLKRSNHAGQSDPECLISINNLVTSTVK